MSKQFLSKPRTESQTIWPSLVTSLDRSLTWRWPNIQIRVLIEEHCTYCNERCHDTTIYWTPHSELRPKRGAEEEDSYDAGDKRTSNHEHTPCATALIMAQSEVVDEGPKEPLFHGNIRVKQSSVGAIIDPGSQKNLVSKSFMEKMGLISTPRSKPYQLGWIQKYAEIKINK